MKARFGRRCVCVCVVCVFNHRLWARKTGSGAVFLGSGRSQGGLVAPWATLARFLSADSLSFLIHKIERQQHLPCRGSF